MKPLNTRSIWVNLRLFSVLILLSGCAAQWHKSVGEEGARYAFQFQRNNTAPTSGVVMIDEAQLAPGDILFSADQGLASRTLRFSGNTSVSHSFVYLGEGKIAEALGSGVRIMPIQNSMADSPLLAVYRYPGLTDVQVTAIQAFAEQHLGSPYNYFGIAKQTPYTITRKICELPVIPRAMRHLCLNTMAVVQVSPFQGNRYFCSQFVVEAFNRAGAPLTKTPPEWVSPGDLLHMRADDIPSVIPVKPLQYVGHLRCQASLWQGSCTLADAS